MKNDYFLAKSHIETIDSREKMGYLAFRTYDNSDKAVACLKEFVGKLMESVALPIENDTIPPLYNTTNDENPDALKTMLVNDGFDLVDW